MKSRKKKACVERSQQYMQRVNSQLSSSRFSLLTLSKVQMQSIIVVDLVIVMIKLPQLALRRQEKRGWSRMTDLDGR